MKARYRIPPQAKAKSILTHPGCLVWLLAIAVLTLLSLTAKLKTDVLSRSPKVCCANNLKQLGLGMQMYLNDHRVFPHASGTVHSIQILYDKGYIDDPDVVVCPAGQEVPAALNPQGIYKLGPDTCSYFWAKAVYTDTSPATAPLAACKRPHGTARRAGRNVLFLEGNVKWIWSKEFEREYKGHFVAR